MGSKITQAKTIREDCDYDDEYEPSKEKTMQQIETAKELIIIAEEYLENKIKNNFIIYTYGLNKKVEYWNNKYLGLREYNDNCKE